ncbi:DUF4867 family protein [Bifidobacterium sp. SMB2]|uniref:DUF4867 family protein n=1 Tax=Bifidobacterium saimiriisciurei TaxID=2661627 RepID=A0ABX0CAU3_9BIFI|nr:MULTISPECIES: DUF4867 family protein [Bifidobacterium]NEG96220.1 DUF4867 family protein [Bifidobacterium sp. SMB2]NEH12233.1 DUF4867 family protein [Bifidobacterium saimiriisciurei]
MILHNVLTEPEAFAPYGRVLPSDYDFSAVVDVLNDHTDAPEDGVVYVPSLDKLEELPVFADLRDRIFGGLTIQAGYCNGTNTTLNALECHRGIEVLVAADDIVLMLGRKQDIVMNDGDYSLDTDTIEAFLVPAGTAVLYYETTMHYAPATTKGSFRTAIVLVNGTNTEKPDIQPGNEEDRILWARNKWLLAHPDSPEAAEGAYVGLVGRNLDLNEDLVYPDAQW